VGVARPFDHRLADHQEQLGLELALGPGAQQTLV
jgi:hypothetical protein